MLFNSLVFAIFLPIVFLLYWGMQRRSLKLQNMLLLVASYVFYGWWDWRFLSLIFISSIVDYVVGLRLHQEARKRQRTILLLVSLLVNLGFLGFFKYFNFFVDSFADLLRMFGLQPHVRTLNVILPVGISFYTFQTLSYTLDIFKRKIEPTRDVIAFFAFVSFFPQLVAGPIERASNLLPQFLKNRRFDPVLAHDGLRQMLWGLFKKVVIADNVAAGVNYAFDNFQHLSGLQLAIGVFLFAIQIYCDFSGYSDIAIGTARLFGFSLMQNFAYPYFSRNIGEFWRRWHISLSSWFRDYVYIPLGGSYVKPWRQVWNILVTFTVSGLWHGANWTFVIWGALNGLYYVPSIFMKKKAKMTAVVAEGKLLPSVKETGQLAVTFALALFAWIFFRAESLQHALSYIQHMVSTTWLVMPESKPAILLSVVLLLIEWPQRAKKHALEIAHLPKFLRWGIYLVLLTLVFIAGNWGENEFIYFQF